LTAVCEPPGVLIIVQVFAEPRALPMASLPPMWSGSALVFRRYWGGLLESATFLI
jgi:hypothetical protein